MLKLNFTKAELEELKGKIYLSEIQERIIEYRLKEYSRVKMAQLENCSIQTIDREINKLAKKILKIMWEFFDKKINKNYNKKFKVSREFYLLFLCDNDCRKEKTICNLKKSNFCIFSFPLFKKWKEIRTRYLFNTHFIVELYLFSLYYRRYEYV